MMLKTPRLQVRKVRVGDHDDMLCAHGYGMLDLGIEDGDPIQTFEWTAGRLQDCGPSDSTA